MSGRGGRPVGRSRSAVCPRWRQIVIGRKVKELNVSAVVALEHAERETVVRVPEIAHVIEAFDLVRCKREHHSAPILFVHVAVAADAAHNAGPGDVVAEDLTAVLRARIASSTTATSSRAVGAQFSGSATTERLSTRLM